VRRCGSPAGRTKSLAAFFEGEAKTAAAGPHREWDIKAREIHQALNSLADAVARQAPHTALA
jgi:hypothetical protein